MDTTVEAHRPVSDVLGETGYYYEAVRRGWSDDGGQEPAGPVR